MKNKSAKYITIFIFILLTNSVFAEGLTRKMIKEMIKAMDKTIVDNDIKGMSMFLSPNVSVELHATEGGVQYFSDHMNKESYLKLYKESMELAKDYKYQREDLQINIRNEGQSAFLKGKVRESLVIDRFQIDAITIDEAIVELIDGVPVFTQITMWTSF